MAAASWCRRGSEGEEASARAAREELVHKISLHRRKKQAPSSTHDSLRLDATQVQSVRAQRRFKSRIFREFSACRVITYQTVN